MTWGCQYPLLVAAVYASVVDEPDKLIAEYEIIAHVRKE